MLELEDEDEDDEEKRPLLEELEIDVASIVSKARCMALPTQANREWLQDSLLRDQVRPSVCELASILTSHSTGFLGTPVVGDCILAADRLGSISGDSLDLDALVFRVCSALCALS